MSKLPKLHSRLLNFKSSLNALEDIVRAMRTGMYYRESCFDGFVRATGFDHDNLRSEVAGKEMVSQSRGCILGNLSVMLLITRP